MSGASLACSRQTLRLRSAAVTRAIRYLLCRVIPTRLSPSTTRQLASRVSSETATAEPRIMVERRERLWAGVSGTTAQIEREMSLAASLGDWPCAEVTASGGSSGSGLPAQPTSASRASAQVDGEALMAARLSGMAEGR